MVYNQMRQAAFLRRPNRFIAECELDGETVVCHVKNTGRCRELLLPGAEVWLEESNNPNRKTKYSLIAVRKGERLINMDSQAPNQVAWEAFVHGFHPHFVAGEIQEVRREVTCGNSRFDLCLTVDGKPFYVEIKGITLEENGVVRFPDAPTVRGTKHVRELTRLRQAGTDTAILFVVQMEGAEFVTANQVTDPNFAQALAQAKENGVKIAAWDCLVTPNSITLRQEVPVKI